MEEELQTTQFLSIMQVTLLILELSPVGWLIELKYFLKVLLLYMAQMQLQVLLTSSLLKEKTIKN